MHCTGLIAAAVAALVLVATRARAQTTTRTTDSTKKRVEPSVGSDSVWDADSFT